MFFGLILEFEEFETDRNSGRNQEDADEAEFKKDGDVLILGDFFWWPKLWKFTIKLGAGVA